MYKYSPSALANNRNDAADILRGIAIAGIILVHAIEHFNFYNFPEQTAFDKTVWETTFFLLGGKMYAIFALLFGFSFYVQHDNQAQKGKDFRLRYAWRLFLLILIGFVDVTFYNGDILVLYAVCGFFIIPLIRLSDKVLWALFLILLIQPVELAYIIGAIFNPDLQPLNLGSGKCFGAMMPAQVSGTFWEMCKVSFIEGNKANFAWSFEVGRFTQIISLFILGIIIGRKRLLYDEGDNMKTWRTILGWSFAAFIPLAIFHSRIPALISNTTISSRLDAMLGMWRNFAMMLVYVSGFILLFYRTRLNKTLMRMSPYGKMSLTNYVGQSIIGPLLFYGWGFGLFKYCTHSVSLAIGMVMIMLQFIFCHWWMKHHKRGPLEELWRRGTWIKLVRK